MNVYPNDAALRHKMYECIKPLLSLSNIRMRILFKRLSVKSEDISHVCIYFKDNFKLRNAFIKYMSDYFKFDNNKGEVTSALNEEVED